MEKATRNRSRASLSKATIQRFIQAARAEDPKAIVEFHHGNDLIRILPEADKAPATPFDAWKAKRDARQVEGH